MAFEEIGSSNSLVQTNKLENGAVIEGFLVGTEPNKFNPNKKDIVMVDVHGRKCKVITCGFLNKVANGLGTKDYPTGVLYRFVRDTAMDYTEKKFNKLVRGFKIQVDRTAVLSESPVGEAMAAQEKALNEIEF
jgi:hypothetical protein